MLESRRGPDGGHRLARPAFAITVADVVRAIEGPLAVVQGRRPEDLRYEGPAERLQDVWVAVRAALRAVLERTTVEQIVTGELPPAVTSLVGEARSWTSVFPIQTESPLSPGDARRNARSQDRAAGLVMVAPVSGCGTLVHMSPLLVARLHVDLQRVTSAACRRSS